jgi:prepilin peptidase CpaA
VFALTPPGLLAGAVFTLLLLLAAVEDVRTRKIPNRLVLVMTLIGLLYSAATAGPLLGTLKGIEGFFAGLAFWIVFYALGWLGAGDVKLVAAAGTWLGPREIVEGSLIAALVGAVLALLWMFRTRGVVRSVETLGVAATLPSVLTQSSGSSDRIRSLPYSVPIAIGALCAAWLPGLLIR